MDIGKLGSSSSESLTNQAVKSVEQSADDSFARKLEAAAQRKDDKELKQVCQEFESIMLSMLYKQMKATVTKSDLIKKDPGTDIFESMQDEQLMEQASKTGSLGLAESLYKQLSRQYGKAATLGGNGVSGPVPDKSKENSQESEPVGEEVSK